MSIRLEDKPKLYVLSPGFFKKQVHSDIILYQLTERLPEYKMHYYLDNNIILIVHNDYRIYKVKNTTGEGCNVYKYADLDDAEYKYQLLCATCPNSLTELSTVNSDDEIIEYKWYKKFTYSSVIAKPPVKPQKKLKIHPFTEYLIP